MKRLFFFFLMFLSISASSFQSGDEIRTVNGKEYKVYKVQKGDTWYAIARKFEISYAELRVANKDTDDKLITGKELLIPAKLNPNDPYFEKSKPDTPAKPAPKSESSSDKYHVVKPSQTLYSISKMFGVTVDQVKEWNNLKSNEISVGQKLLVSKKSNDSEPVKVIAQPAISTEDTKITKPAEEVPAKTEAPVEKTETGNTVESKAEVKEPVKDEPKEKDKIDTALVTSQVEDMPPPAEDTKINETPVNNPPANENTSDEVVFGNGRQQVNETGSAVVIGEDENTTEKYFALHKTAKTGTVIRVMNLANSRKTYVKVIGQMPDDSENSGTLIKISKATAEKLGITDKSARVNLLYGIGGD